MAFIEEASHEALNTQGKAENTQQQPIPNYLRITFMSATEMKKAAKTTYTDDSIRNHVTVGTASDTAGIKTDEKGQEQTLIATFSDRNAYNVEQYVQDISGRLEYKP